MVLDHFSCVCGTVKGFAAKNISPHQRDLGILGCVCMLCESGSFELRSPVD